jgi:hypothetical protein
VGTLNGFSTLVTSTFPISREFLFVCSTLNPSICLKVATEKQRMQTQRNAIPASEVLFTAFYRRLRMICCTRFLRWIITGQYIPYFTWCGAIMVFKQELTAMQTHTSRTLESKCDRIPLFWSKNHMKVKSNSMKRITIELNSLALSEFYCYSSVLRNTALIITLDSRLKVHKHSLLTAVTIHIHSYTNFLFLSMM